MNNRVLITTLANDPHTQGLFKFTRLAREAGFEVKALPPGATLDQILGHIQADDPAYVGFSYRLTPEIGLAQMEQVMQKLAENGLLNQANGEVRKFAFAGLPATVELVQGTLSQAAITGIQQTAAPRQAVEQVLDFLGVWDARRERIIAAALARLAPPRLQLLDQLAVEVTATVELEPPLETPSIEARRSYTQRIREAWPQRPILRTHYGEPGSTIEPTVLGIRNLAEARVIDELSLGSSDLSQRYYNEPEKWLSRKNDGGVPYKTLPDLVALHQAAQCGNYPAVKPYSHVVNMEWFVDECLRAGMLIGAHQAVPLYWFNQLDGRGPLSVGDSITEHIRTVRKLTQNGIPVEMNDPNHWSSRWASDAVVVADYGLIASVMLANGVKDMVFQMQFNKPKETSDCGDLAKFLASMDLVRLLVGDRQAVNVWREARTGIDHFEPDLELARGQLARSTLLQMMLDPHAIHLVSYCEALYAAKPDDIIRSSSIIRKAVKVFHQHQPELLKYLETPEITERRVDLLKEARLLLGEIAQLHPRYDAKKAGMAELFEYLADPDTLYAALDKGYMAAPGIFTEPFIRNAVKTHTDVTPAGMINSIDPVTLNSISEEERLRQLAHT